MQKLLTEYYELLQQAEHGTDRDTAIDCIRRSTKLREQMKIVNLQEQLIMSAV